MKCSVINVRLNRIMHVRNSSTHYGIVTQLIHWIMFFLISGMVFIGFYMEDLPLGPQKLDLIFWHKSFGITVLFLAVIRLFWRWTNPTPKLPETLPLYQRLAAHLTHYALYGFMFLLPLSGWLMSSAANFPVSVFGWFNMPNIIDPDKSMVKFFKEIHEIAVFGILGLLILHIGAALMHHFIYKDTILKRMISTKDITS